MDVMQKGIKNKWIYGGINYVFHLVNKKIVFSFFKKMDQFYLNSVKILSTV